MQDVVTRLTDSLRQRFKGKTSSKKPDVKEIASWGAKQVHWTLPILFALGGGLLLIGGTAATASIVGVEALLAAALVVGAVIGSTILGPLALVLLYVWRTKRNQHLAITAYKKLLERNERFALVEYAKYLKRRVRQARAQGAPRAQVQRLAEAYQQLRELIQQGAGDTQVGVKGQGAVGNSSAQVSIEDEAQLAESLAEVYDFANKAGSLNWLDQQLAPEVRQRIEELEQKLEAGRYGELHQADDLESSQPSATRSSELE